MNVTMIGKPSNGNDRPVSNVNDRASRCSASFRSKKADLLNAKTARGHRKQWSSRNGSSRTQVHRSGNGSRGSSFRFHGRNELAAPLSPRQRHDHARNRPHSGQRTHSTRRARNQANNRPEQRQAGQRKQGRSVADKPQASGSPKVEGRKGGWRLGEGGVRTHPFPPCISPTPQTTRRTWAHIP